MTSRFRLVLIAGLLSMALAGCGDAFHAGTIQYKDSELFTSKAKAGGSSLLGKPQLQEAVRKTLADIFGARPQEIKVPKGSGLPQGGRYLANFENSDGTLQSITYVSASTGAKEPVTGGYGLYRKYCLHCHGVSGGGDGPTSDFLFPHPRNFRQGKFKFTSVNPSNPKPTRSDMRKTLVYGLHGSSMPAFEALMSKEQIEQVIDYVIFLSMRGETERNLVIEAALSDKDDPSALAADTVQEILTGVIDKWKAVDSLVVRPKVARVAPTRESVLRGRDLYLGAGKKVACTDCHGLQGMGNGGSFIEKKLYDKIVFPHPLVKFGPETTEAQQEEAKKVIEAAIKARYREVQDEETSAHMDPHSENGAHGSAAGETTAEDTKFKEYEKRMLTAWDPGSLDEWGNPLRPNNLNLGVYRGGRRPIDLYWRITKGINGAKMPAHGTILTEEQTWDMVNFVLALPYEPDLLKDAEALNKKFSEQPAGVTQR